MDQGAIQTAWVAAAGPDELAEALFARAQALASTSAGNVTGERKGGGLAVRRRRWAYTSGSIGASSLAAICARRRPTGRPRA